VYSTLKNKVLSNNPSNEDDLKGAIQSKVLSISPAKLENAIQNLFVKLHMSANKGIYFHTTIQIIGPFHCCQPSLKYLRKQCTVG